MSVLESVGAFRERAVPRQREVAIAPDGDDYVVTFWPDNVVVFRHGIASELRRMCDKLKWKIVSDTAPDPQQPAS